MKIFLRFSKDIQWRQNQVLHPLGVCWHKQVYQQYSCIFKMLPRRFGWRKCYEKHPTGHNLMFFIVRPNWQRSSLLWRWCSWLISFRIPSWRQVYAWALCNVAAKLMKKTVSKKSRIVFSKSQKKIKNEVWHLVCTPWLMMLRMTRSRGNG